MHNIKQHRSDVHQRSELGAGWSAMNSFMSLLLVVALGLSNFVFAKNPVPKAPPKGTESGKPAKLSEEGDFVIEQRGDGSKVKYKKKTSYDFEGANIDGMYNKPSGSYISNIKDVKAKSIIRVRENFDAEVVDSERLLK